MKKVRYAVGAAAVAPIAGMMVPGAAAAATAHSAAHAPKKATKTVALYHRSATNATAASSSASSPNSVVAAARCGNNRHSKTSLFLSVNYNYTRHTNDTCVGTISLIDNILFWMVSSSVFVQRPGHRYCRGHFGGTGGFVNCNASFKRPFSVVGQGITIRGTYHTVKYRSA